MGSHPINLAFRFILELTALLLIGIWGWQQSEMWLKFILAFGIPMALAAVWGIFAVPNDPSRSGKAPIIIPGILRLIIELLIFSFAIWTLYDLGYIKLFWIIGLLVVIHYIISYYRILWLLKL